MTGYQKLKIENKILWEEVKEFYDAIKLLPEEWREKMLTEVALFAKDEDEAIEDLKWQIKRAQHEEKN